MATLHDVVIKWTHFQRHWPFVRGIHRSPVNSPHKGQWRGASMFSLIWAWINSCVNNREAGNLRRHRAHYDVIVMLCLHIRVNIYEDVCPLPHINEFKRYEMCPYEVWSKLVRVHAHYPYFTNWDQLDMNVMPYKYDRNSISQINYSIEPFLTQVCAVIQRPSR